VKVAIGFPSREMVHASFALDLATLMGNAVASGHEMGIFNCEGTLICDQRTTLAKKAVDSGADYVLWLDSDMRFPKDALTRLLAHGKDIVGANYVTRALPVSPTARNFTDGQWWKVPTYNHSTGLEEVTAAGMGLMLTSTKVFKKMPAPWFHIGYATANEMYTGEDVYFGIHAAKEGFKVFIDHDLSKEVRHTGSIEFMHDHFALFDKPKAP